MWCIKTGRTQTEAMLKWKFTFYRTYVRKRRKTENQLSKLSSLLSSVSSMKRISNQIQSKWKGRNQGNRKRNSF